MQNKSKTDVLTGVQKGRKIMAEIYIAFVDTPGFFAGIIRRVIKQKYIHVALSLDPYLEETYSIGRRHPSVPLIAGFEKEDKYKILRAFPDADYMICRISTLFWLRNIILFF